MEENDIIDLEKDFWLLKSQSKTGRFDVQAFKSTVCPPLPESLAEGNVFSCIMVRKVSVTSDITYLK